MCDCLTLSPGRVVPGLQSAVTAAVMGFRRAPPGRTCRFCGVCARHSPYHCIRHRPISQREDGTALQFAQNARHPTRENQGLGRERDITQLQTCFRQRLASDLRPAWDPAEGLPCSAAYCAQQCSRPRATHIQQAPRGRHTPRQAGSAVSPEDTAGSRSYAP